MNCKPGDLAVVVRSYAGNEGKIVRCLKLHPPGSFNTDEKGGFVWEIDIQLKSIWSHSGGVAPSVCSICDSQLRPIRDQDGEDETLTWAGKPKVREQA